MNNRLESRKTCIEWDKYLVGPIHDERGLEQGGVSSSTFYQIFGKEQLTTAQASKLGVELSEDSIISGIGQADDILLVSNDIQSLRFLLLLTKIFCEKYQVELCAEKTKLQVFSTKDMALDVDYAEVMNPLEIGG